jgi:hypothetical protein
MMDNSMAGAGQGGVGGTTGERLGIGGIGRIGIDMGSSLGAVGGMQHLSGG